MFQGTATNDGTVAEAVFLGSSRNIGTVTASATFANSSINAGMVHGAAVLVDVAHNMGTIAGSVQLGASATNAGSIFGSLTSHAQGDGAYAYGYYAGGVRTAPPNYTTVVHQVGEFWHTYDASGFASLANGEYDDGTTATFVFVQGVRAAQTGGVVAGEGRVFLAGSVNTLWNTLENWIDDNGLPAASLPDTFADVVIVNAGSTRVECESSVQVATVTLSGNVLLTTLAEAVLSANVLMLDGSSVGHDGYGTLANIYGSISATINSTISNLNDATSYNPGDGSRWVAPTNIDITWYTSETFTVLASGYKSATDAVGSSIFLYIVNGKSTLLNSTGNTYWDENWISTNPGPQNSSYNITLYNGLFYQSGILYTGVMYNEWNEYHSEAHTTTYVAGIIVGYN